MGSSARIIGVGQTACGRFAEATVASLAIAALDAALSDAAIGVDRVQAIFFSNALSGLLTGQECVRGQVALRSSRYGGIPTVNVENACASGSSALHLACQAIDSGAYETVAVVGSEKMSDPDRERPIRALSGAADVALLDGTPSDHSVFMDSYAQRARRRIEEQGWEPADFAKVVVKNRRHAAQNPGAQYRRRLTVEEVLASRMITAPLTLPMCSPIGDGAAALVVSVGGRGAPGSVHVRASALSGAGGSAAGSVAERAAAAAREQSGVAAADVDVLEIHDATASAELEAYEHLRLAPEGEANRLLDEGRTALGGALPVNTSGGLLGRGHPVGATGVLQIAELVQQLRGHAGARQVEPTPRLALAHNAGGFVEGDNAVAVITILERTR
ncbi:MAG TPA: thiolase family protein [Solirubrobacteraceae bacterium]|nr:thiolase family protein [Solirubrobacteraceae bacterium]